MNLLKISGTSRYFIQKDKDSVTITIKSRQNIGALLFFVLWLLLWVYMFLAISIPWSIGLLGTTGIADTELQASPVFIVMFCGFSIFMLLMLMMGIYAIYAFLREIAGKELIVINKSGLIVAYQLFGWKREKEFPIENIDGLIIRNTSQRFFWNPLQKKYIYAFELSHERKTYRFGFFVKENDAQEIVSAIQTFIPPTS